jgi:TIR domain
MAVFLSYAKEDGEAALKIATRLVQLGFEVYRWQEPRQRGGRFVERIEEEINRADAFLALVSPNFLNSPWCRWERELAIHRESDLRGIDPTRQFIHVLKILDTPYPAAGFLRAYDWIDLTTAGVKEQELSILASNLRANGMADFPGSGVDSPDRPSPKFRNREDELNKLVRGLTTSGGTCFWLVIAPPKLGKSWLLARLSAEVASPERFGPATELSGWDARLVDIRDQPVEARSDAALLLARLFGLSSPLTIEPKTIRRIAQDIIKSGRPYLCLLDSAELLEGATAEQLRSYLSSIYHLLENARNVHIRLGLVVASRRDDEWRGVIPDPPLFPLPLTEFRVDVVRQALDDLAQQMDRPFAPLELNRYARRIHRLSEGLPALLAECLQWIQREEWLEMRRLEGEALFDELAQSYIRDRLLSIESLLPGVGSHLNESRHALEQAFRVLTPYRLFTQSHLHHHLTLDDGFEQALNSVGWGVKDDLWTAINRTALLLRPLNEPWQEIYPAIRRILYRHYYKTDEERATAHREARKFMEIWMDKQVGKEQVKGVVECLWHEAVALRLERSPRIREELGESARYLCRTLRPSTAYTVEELRVFAAELMSNDPEFREAVSRGRRMFDDLIHIVKSPPQEPQHQGGQPVP